MEPPILLTTIEAAKYLSVKPATLRHWTSNERHKIPHRKIGRCIQYLKSDLDAFIESRTRFR